MSDMSGQKVDTEFLGRIRSLRDRRQRDTFGQITAVEQHQYLVDHLSYYYKRCVALEEEVASLRARQPVKTHPRFR